MKKRPPSKQIMKTYWNLSDDDDSEITETEYSTESSSSSDDEADHQKTNIFIGNTKLKKFSTSSKLFITGDQQKCAKNSSAKFVDCNAQKDKFTEPFIRSNRPPASASIVKVTLPKVTANEETKKRSVTTITIRSPVSSNRSKGSQKEVGHVLNPLSTVKTSTEPSLTTRITSNDAKVANDTVKDFQTAKSIAKYPSLTKLKFRKTSPVTLVRMNDQKSYNLSELQVSDEGNRFSDGNNGTSLSLDESLDDNSVIAQGDSILINGDPLIFDNDSKMTISSSGNQYYQSKSVIYDQADHTNHSDFAYLADGCDNVSIHLAHSSNTNNSNNITWRVSTYERDEGDHDYEAIHDPDHSSPNQISSYHSMKNRHVLVRSTQIQETNKENLNDFLSTNYTESRSSSEESWPSPPADNFLTESITLEGNNGDAIAGEISMSFAGQLSAEAVITSPVDSAIKGDVKSITSNGNRDENDNYIVPSSFQQQSESQISPYSTILHQTYAKIFNSNGKNDESEIMTTKGKKQLISNFNNEQQSNIEASNDRLEEILKTESSKKFDRNFTTESRAEKMSVEYDKLPSDEKKAWHLKNGNGEDVNAFRENFGPDQKAASHNSETDGFIYDEHYDDDESCILCEIMSNEERLARRSVDMDSFRKSALNDCDKVLKKMKHARKIVRKLSGGESPRKLLNNEIMRDVIDRKKPQEMINSSIQHVPRQIDREAPNAVPTEQCSEDSDHGKSKTVPRETIFCLTGPRTVLALNVPAVNVPVLKASAPLNAEAKNFNNALNEGKHVWNEKATKAVYSSSKEGITKKKQFTNEENRRARSPHDQESPTEHDLQTPQDRTLINRNDSNKPPSQEIIAPYEAARRHCIELIDAGGYLIPQPSMKKQSKTKKRLTEDFKIVESMPCSQVKQVIEPQYHAFYAESSSEQKSESHKLQVQNYQAEEHFRQSLSMPDQYQAAYSISGNTAFVNGHQTPESVSLQSGQSQSTHSQSQGSSRSKAMRSPASESQSPQSNSSRSQAMRSQSPQSNSSRSQAMRSYSPQPQPDPLAANRHETTSTTDQKRAEREASWLKKAVRRLRRSLSFEDDKKPAVAAHKGDRRYTMKASSSSGNIPLDFAFKNRDSRGHSHSDDEGHRDNSRRRGNSGQRGDSGQRGNSVKDIRQMHNYHSSGRNSHQQRPSTVQGHYTDPQFHPKYGFAPTISQRNSKAKIQSSNGDSSYNGKQIKQTNGETDNYALNYNRKQKASNNIYFGSNPQVQSSPRFDAKERINQCHGYERSHPFKAPLEIKMISQRKAATKHLQSKT